MAALTLITFLLIRLGLPVLLLFAVGTYFERRQQTRREVL
jgi:hypothetical protein